MQVSQRRWEPDSPAWVTHQQLLEENCRLRNRWTALWRDLEALEGDMTHASVGWVTRLRNILQRHR